LASFIHEGRRGFLSVFVTWDERRRILAADLLEAQPQKQMGSQPVATGTSVSLPHSAR